MCGSGEGVDLVMAFVMVTFNVLVIKLEWAGIFFKQTGVPPNSRKEKELLVVIKSY